MPSTLRVLLAFSDLDDEDTWLDALDSLVLVVDDEPDVVLTDGSEGVEGPVVMVSAGAVVSGSWVAPDASPEAVVSALWATSLGLEVASARPVVEMTPSLTPREREVLELLALGLSNREIGEALQISAHPAKFHVQGLLDKLDATTRMEAAVRAARMWLI